MTIRNISPKRMHDQSSLSERQHLGAANSVGRYAPRGILIRHMLRVLYVDRALRMVDSPLKGRISRFCNCPNDLLVTTVQRTENGPQITDANNVDAEKVLTDG